MWLGSEIARTDMKIALWISVDAAKDNGIVLAG